MQGNYPGKQERQHISGELSSRGNGYMVNGKLYCDLLRILFEMDLQLCDE